MKSCKYKVLFIEFEDCIKNDKELLNNYNTRIKKHNNMVKNNLFPDSGFDILLPKLEADKYIFYKNETKLIPFGIKCSVYEFFGKLSDNLPNYEIIQSFYVKGSNSNVKPMPFTIHPRSSIWKSKFRLANCTGIIDMGYRGTIFGSLHNIDNNENFLKYGNRYLQICMPDLLPFYVKVVKKVENDSNRGKGGIGSTGC